MRKLEGVKKDKYDILIIDHNGIEWLKYCIPEQFTSSVIRTHQSLPFVKSFTFIVRVFQCIARWGINSVSLMSAITKELQPKVIITFIDNNKFMGVLQSIFPDILCISIQNGVRGLGFQEYEDAILSYPHYFGFGDYESEVITRKNKTVEKYYSKGSFKMGVFLVNLYKPKNREERFAKRICVISQWHKVGVSPLFDQYLIAYQNICKLLSRFSSEFEVDVVIAARKGKHSDREDCQNELGFFQAIFGDNMTYVPNDRLRMSSYSEAMDSDLNIGFDSTLLFELLGTKKKVFACGSADKEFSYDFNNIDQISSLPDETVLNNIDYEEFKSKVLNLLEMSNKEYINITAEARKYYMNFGNEYPHQIIYNMIQERCEQ